MSYHDLLMQYGSKRESAETRLYIYCQAPGTLTTVERVAYRDKNAAADIARLERLIEDLKDYRQALAVRYAELETMSFRYRLELHRHPAWNGGGVKYELQLVKLYSDGTEINEWREVLPGKERRAALEKFAQMQKQRPGIEVVLDIEKRYWER